MSKADFSRTLSSIPVFYLTLILFACGGGNGGGGGGRTTPTVTVSPAATSITAAQSLAVTIMVSGRGSTPTGTVVLSSGTYTSSTETLSLGGATITIPAGSLAMGSNTLTARYTPDGTSSPVYNSASGTASVTVTSASGVTVTVTPDSTTLPSAENLIVAVAVAGNSGTPTGSVVLSSGSYTSPSRTLNSGSATIYVSPGSLATGSDTLTATYTPDPGGSYGSDTGTAAITVTSPGSTNVTVTIDTLANRHQISPYIYGVNTANSNNVSGLSPGLVRWGGNQTSNYNWKTFTYNSGADWYFEDFGLGNQNGNINDSVGMVSYVVGAGSHMLTTMPTMDWVAKESGHWSFSVAKYGAQCGVDPYNTDAGNGRKPDCRTRVATGPLTDAYYPLVNTAGDCTTGNCLYRDEWTAALSAAFGNGTCKVPYSPITSCHFYSLDNEPEIWDGTHNDIHPDHPGYTELSNVFETVGAKLKTWDPKAVRFGPVTCCWNFYWTAGPSGDDKSAHGGVDFLPWWLNQIYWLDQINGLRTLDVVDVHAYSGVNVDISSFTNAQKRAIAGNLYRTYWDPTYLIPGDDADWITTTQPNRAIRLQIPRLKALANAIYPGTPLSFSEWEAFVVPQSEWDFATALSDADAYGIMGREGLSFSTRWGGPDATDDTTKQPHPNYQALKLYTTYDGAKHGFGTISILDQNDRSPDLFSSFAALNAAGTTMTIMVLNKDPNNSANVTFNLNGFNASTYTAYTLASTNPGSITSSASAAWSATQSFAPYSITLLVVNGTETSKPASEWYLNPDALMIPASGTATLNPAITSGTTPVTLASAAFDAYAGAPVCSGTLTITNSTITPSQPAAISVNPGSTPGFCHYTVTGNDGTATQTQGGWIVVSKPAAIFTKSGDNQTGTPGNVLPQPLTVTLNPGQSGGSAAGASVFFTTSAGSLQNVQVGSEQVFSGSNVIAVTNSSGVASVTLTLPQTSGAQVQVTAEGPYGLGHPVATFTETTQ
jgi:hypothetical protein